jgi:hypothetical protein
MPNSLLGRGKPDDARRVLRRVRDADDVDAEYHDLAAASEASSAVERPWRDILRRKYRLQLVMAVAIPVLQQLTGINVIMYYTPVLFKTLGFGGSVSLMSAVITGVVNLVATLVSVFTVDSGLAGSLPLSVPTEFVAGNQRALFLPPGGLITVIEC